MKSSKRCGRLHQLYLSDLQSCSLRHPTQKACGLAWGVVHNSPLGIPLGILYSMGIITSVRSTADLMRQLTPRQPKRTFGLAASNEKTNCELSFEVQKVQNDKAIEEGSERTTNKVFDLILVVKMCCYS